MIGKIISHYKILEKLGSGGMGEVYLAQDTKLERKVALKFLPHYYSHDKEIIKRFEREAKAAAALNHPNIVTVHEISEFEGQIFIAMEYIKGSSLRDHIKAGPLALPSVLDIVFQLCDGLKKAHQAGITHRDIKPENILIDEDGWVKIVDFGLAKLKGASKLTKDTSTPGTVYYMSPEQVMGEEVDHRSDIWSVGVVLYEMMTGQLPFKGVFEQVVLAAIKIEEPKPLKELCPDIPDEIAQIVNNSLVKNPNERYQQINELSIDLDNLRSLQAILPRKKRKRFSSLVIPIIVLTIGIITIVGYFLFDQFLPQQTSDRDELIQTRQKNSIAIMYFKNNTGDDKLDHWRTALSDLMITDLSQSKYVKVLSSDQLFKILSKLKQADAETYSSDVLQDVADRGNVEHILVGNYSRAGDNFRIDAVLKRISNSEIIGSERVDGIGEAGMFSMVDELTRRIKKNFNLSAEMIDNDIDENIGKITTAYPEALKYWSEARKYFIMTGSNEGCVEILKKAIAIDPEFAMATSFTAVCYGNLGYLSKAKKYIQQALALAHRVSERERYMIQAIYYNIIRDYINSITTYKKLLQLYPDQPSGHNNLGLNYLMIEEWGMAIAHFEMGKTVEPDMSPLYMNQARAYATKGKYDSARAVLEYYKNNISAKNLAVDVLLAMISISQKKYDLALVEIDKLPSYDPDLFYRFLTKGYVFQSKDDLIVAQREYQQLLHAKQTIAHRLGRLNLGNLYTSSGNYKISMDQYNSGIELAQEIGEQGWKAEFQLNLAYVHLKFGNYSETLKFIELAWKNAVEMNDKFFQIDILYLKGLYYTEMGMLDSTENAANSIKRLVEMTGCKKKIRCYHDLKGMITLKRKNYLKSIRSFQTAISLLPYQYYIHHDIIYPKSYHTLFLDHLASAYYGAGDVQKAQQTYERIISLTFGKLDFGDVVAKSYYNLGKISETKGWEGKAIEHYSKFIDMWRECDPEFRPFVEDARHRIEKLNQ